MHPLKSDAPLRRILHEYMNVRAHNERCLDALPQALLVTEGSLALLFIERFLRVLLNHEVAETDTLASLFERATGRRVNAIDPPLGFAHLPGPRSTNERNREFFADHVVDRLRNPLMHANYEQAMDGSRATDAADYLASGAYRGDLETLNQVVLQLAAEFDEQGQRHWPTDRTREQTEAETEAARERMLYLLSIRTRRLSRGR